VQQLQRVITDLSSASDHPTLEMSDIDLSQVVNDAVEQILPLAQAQQRQLTWHPHAPLIVRGDPVRLGQVFSNLLHNAVKFTDPGGTVSVVTQVDGDAAGVTIADTGNGIAPELLPRIFDLFVRQPTDRGGTGIGLSVVRRLVELHGGTVEAHSPGSGHGSKFVVRLPLA
jgi:signal transduction histidine kinase